MTELETQILDAVVDHYLSSRDFNGHPATRWARDKECVVAVCSLIQQECVDLVRGDGHPNPHIKALAAEPVATQLLKIDASGLEGCVYPTPRVLAQRGAGEHEPAPYTKELLQGTPQLEFRAFDLRSLEWYRNDPRFEYQVDDIHGRILQRADSQIGDRRVVRDGLEFLEFGFAYDNDMNRAVAVFVRYLHDLPVDQQLEMQKHQLQGSYHLHPDFFRTQVIGDFPERSSIYDAFLEEKFHINRICEQIGKPPLFRTEYHDQQRPRGFGILIRPTNKEFRDFSLLLDQLLSDDLVKDFFDGDIELRRKLRDEAGEEVVMPRGTIALLEEWINKYFRPSDPETVKEMIKNFRDVRTIRQKPAHKIEDDNFDQVYLASQRDLIVKAYDAVHTLRMILENHPRARRYEVPEHVRNAKVWTF